ncbi:MAG: T9SS type A sorting domain-containing protein, partial [Ignavibacteriales bacterium]|nr:T9SS type A sorting domain-containing protein [Ignavibacteriales bacterium]
ITSGQYIIEACESDTPGIYISSDNGNSWLRSNNGLTNTGVRCLTKNNDYLFTGTWGGGVFRSADTGKTWQAVGVDGEAVKSILAVDSVIFAGASPRVYFSTDNGNTWNYSTLPYPSGDLRNFYYDGFKVYACDFGLYSSSNMGISWELEYGVVFDSVGTPIDVKQFMDITGYNNFLIGSIALDGIYISSDSGASWNSFNEGIDSNWTFTGLAVKTPYIFALKQDFGSVYKRDLSEITNVEEITKTVPEGFTLYQNYPNPFNPTTTISFSLSEDIFVSLKIFDILGREVETLLSDKFSAGTYSEQWNATNLPSGIYLYQINAGNFTETRKLVLIK